MENYVRWQANKKFLNHCEAHESLLVRVRTHRNRQALQYTYFLSPSHTNTHTPLPLSCKGWPFPPTAPLCSVLFCSAWIRTLVWAITSSTGGEGPSIPPSMCYSIPGSILSRGQGDESNAGGKEQAITFQKLLQNHKENPAMISKQKKVAVSFCMQLEDYAWEKKKGASFIAADELLQVSHKKDNGRSAAKQLGYCLQRCRILNRAVISGALWDKSTDTKGLWATALCHIHHKKKDF